MGRARKMHLNHTRQVGSVTVYSPLCRQFGKCRQNKLFPKTYNPLNVTCTYCKRAMQKAANEKA